MNLKRILILAAMSISALPREALDIREARPSSEEMKVNSSRELEKGPSSTEIKKLMENVQDSNFSLPGETEPTGNLRPAELKESTPRPASAEESNRPELSPGFESRVLGLRGNDSDAEDKVNQEPEAVSSEATAMPIAEAVPTAEAVPADISTAERDRNMLAAQASNDPAFLNQIIAKSLDTLREREFKIAGLEAELKRSKQPQELTERQKALLNITAKPVAVKPLSPMFKPANESGIVTLALTATPEQLETLLRGLNVHYITVNALLEDLSAMYPESDWASLQESIANAIKDIDQARTMRPVAALNYLHLIAQHVTDCCMRGFGKNFAPDVRSKGINLVIKSLNRANRLFNKLSYGEELFFGPLQLSVNPETCFSIIQARIAAIEKITTTKEPTVAETALLGGLQGGEVNPQLLQYLLANIPAVQNVIKLLNASTNLQLGLNRLSQLTAGCAMKGISSNGFETTDNKLDYSNNLKEMLEADQKAYAEFLAKTAAEATAVQATADAETSTAPGAETTETTTPSINQPAETTEADTDAKAATNSAAKANSEISVGTEVAAS